MLTETLLTAQARQDAAAMQSPATPGESATASPSAQSREHSVDVDVHSRVPAHDEAGTYLAVPAVRTSKSKSRSRPGSRPRGSRNHSVSSMQYFPQGPEGLVVPDAVISEDVAEMLHEFVHPHHGHHEDVTLVEEEEDGEGGDDGDDGGDDGRAWMKQLPWWRRPSPWWLLLSAPFAAIAVAATIAPKIEIYTILACEVYRPELTSPGHGSSTPIDWLVSAALQGHDPINSLDERSRQKCASDPVVQAAVAELMMLMTTTMGVLSCITAGWWGSLSDRFGRTRVMSFSVVGILFTDFNFILVAKFARFLPGHYYFLICGPIIEGLLGGMTAVSATIHVYIADCTDHDNRTRVFARFAGILLIGVALGPVFGGLLVQYLSSVISLFYVTAATHFIFALLVWFVIPESLSRSRMLESRKKRSTASDLNAQNEGGVWTWLKKPFIFLSPLGIFLPSKIEGKSGRDWSLTCIVLAQGFMMTIMGSYGYKMQYVKAAFDWGVLEIGYWLSAICTVRAVFLVAILPVIIHLFKPKRPAIELPVEPSEPLQPEPSATSSPPQTDAHVAAFDLGLARVSLLIEFTSYVLLSLASTGVVFAACSLLGAFGTGFGPAISNVAFTLYTDRGGRETGKLFGALGVVQALSAQILGPTVFGTTYVLTVATFPRAIFFVAVGVAFVALVLITFVRLPATVADVEDQFEATGPPGIEREVTLVDTEVPTGDAGGKPVSSSG